MRTPRRPRPVIDPATGRAERARPPDRGGRSSESGTASTLVIAICGALLTLTMALLAVLGAYPARALAAAAADAAALAAADTLSGRADGAACARAARFAELHGARLERCTTEGLVVEVVVAVELGWLCLRERARAGPPGTAG